MLEQKASLIEAANGLKGGMFVHIHGYCTNEVRKIDGKETVVFFEKSNVTFHADANYESTHQRSAEALDAIEANPDLVFTITRNAWVDQDGNEYTRKAKGRTLKENIVETITAKDKDLAEAIAKARKSIIDPRHITDNFEKIAKSTYDNDVTGKTYMRNVLISEKVSVEKQGKYPTPCQERVNAIKDAILDVLPVGKYRQYILDDETVLDTDGKEHPRFEYISLMHECVSSSSSSDV